MILLLNGRSIDINSLRAGKFTANSDFEERTQQFIVDWLEGKDLFPIKTSGSTGAPTTCIFTRKQLEASARLTEKALRLREGLWALLSLDPRYVAGQMMIVRAFVTGMDLIAVEPSTNPFEMIPDSQPVDFAALVPQQLEAVASTPAGIERLNRLNMILVGGAPAQKELKALVTVLTVPVFATYGMTETLTHIALQKLNGPDAADLFEALPGIEITKDDRGCLVIHAAHLPSAVVTNDLVDLASDRHFRVLGRWDNVINSGGVKVIPEKIESATTSVFTSLRLTNRLLAVGIPDRTLGERIVLVVEGDALSKEIQEAILIQLRATLEKYEVPKEIRFIDKFIETETQKVNRRANVEQLGF